MNINILTKKQKKNKLKRQQPETPVPVVEIKEKKRIKIDLSQNQTREFFSHGKVATMTLPESKHRSKSPRKAAIKKVSTIGVGKKK